MNVARAALHGVCQNQVDELDDRSFFGGAFEGGRVKLFFFGGDFQIGRVAGEVLHHLAEFFDARCIAVKLVNRFVDVGFGCDHRLDVEAGHKLNVVHREDVGGVRHRNRESGANAREWNDLITHSRFLRDQLDHRGFNFVIF